MRAKSWATNATWARAFGRAKTACGGVDNGWNTPKKTGCLGVKDLNNQWLYEHDVVTSKEHDGAWLVVHFANQWALVQQDSMISAPTYDRQLKRIGFKFPLKKTSDEVDVPHQLFLVGAADGDFQISHLHGVLERVDVLNLIQVHHKIPAHTDEAV